MEEPPWKKLKLSLERPYKDDNGEPIPVLEDITPEGKHKFEPRKDLTADIGERLVRIFVERGHDFFDKRNDQKRGAPELSSQDADAGEDPSTTKETSEVVQPMTPEELFRMRMELIPQLHIAYGEMCQARDLLTLLLSTATPSQGPLNTENPSTTLTATIVTKPPPIQSVQAFNAQLVVGGKDRALRDAAELFRTAANGMEKSRTRSEKYFLDALKIRRGNWGLIPAPLPPGSSIGKGADKTSKDFLVSFSLEESPLVFRRRAIGRIPTNALPTDNLEFPLRQHTRLQVSITFTDPDGQTHHATNTFRNSEGPTIDLALRAAQAEVVEQEIFSILIREAGNLPTASARVSERLIVIEAAQATELSFELLDSEATKDRSQTRGSHGATCDLIFSLLHILLLRAHNHMKANRLGPTGILRPPLTAQDTRSPPLLQPIIDFLQYQVFCKRIRHELSRMIRALQAAGIPTKMLFNTAGETGEELIALLQKNVPLQVAGDCLVRVDNRYSLRFTFSSPSSLTAHLPQATLTIASITQLTQLLVDEIGSCILNRICDVGSTLCEHVQGTWFVDLLTGRSIGRWEGHVLNFRVSFENDDTLVCSVSRLERADQRPSSHVETYTATRFRGVSLMQWIEDIIRSSLPSP